MGKVCQRPGGFAFGFRLEHLGCFLTIFIKLTFDNLRNAGKGFFNHISKRFFVVS